MTIERLRFAAIAGAALLAAQAGSAAAEPGSPEQSAEPLTADQAMENYRKRFESVDEIDCPKPTDPDEILVCGRSGAADPNRLPLPVERVPGEHIAGEPVGGAAFSCLRNCYQGIDIIKVLTTGKKIIDHILHPD
jgi:hypothetical protein